MLIEVVNGVATANSNVQGHSLAIDVGGGIRNVFLMTRKKEWSSPRGN